LDRRTQPTNWERLPCGVCVRRLVSCMTWNLHL